MKSTTYFSTAFPAVLLVGEKVLAFAIAIGLTVLALGLAFAIFAGFTIFTLLLKY